MLVKGLLPGKDLAWFYHRGGDSREAFGRISLHSSESVMRSTRYHFH